MYRLNCINYCYNDQYYFQVEYNRAIKIKNVTLIDSLKNKNIITEESLTSILNQNGFSLDCVQFLIKNNIILKDEDYKKTMVYMLKKLLNLIENGEVNEINSIFVYSPIYGFRTINMCISAIELDCRFQIKRSSINDMTIIFESGYVYDINTKYNIFGENITGCIITMSKSLTNYFLASHGIKVPKQRLFFCEDLRGLDKFVDEIQYPICLKPNNMAESKDVYPRIQSRAELDRAIVYYKSRYKEFVVEKSHFGNTFRLFYCYGEIIGATQKSVCYVIGDGISTIENLINNKYPPKTFESIKNQCLMIFDRLKVSKNNILPRGTRLNISETGTESKFNYIQLNKIDKLYIELASKVARVTGLNNFAIDLLADSLYSKSSEPIIVELQESPEFDRGDAFAYKYYAKVVQSICIIKA